MRFPRLALPTRARDTLLTPSDQRGWRFWLKRTASLAALGGALTVANCSGLMEPVDEGLAAARFRLMPHKATDSLATVVVDPASIQAAGHWPLDRKRLAHALLNLQNAGAEQIGLDLDLSGGATPEGDELMAAVFARRPGQVVVPARVSGGVSAAGPLIDATPLGRLSRDTVLVSSGIQTDADGKVRRHPYAAGEGALRRPDMVAVLAGVDAAKARDFGLDRSLKTKPQPPLSFEQVYQGKFDPARVAGRTVLIGAATPELTETYALADGRKVSRMQVQALAFETLRAGRGLQGLSPTWTLAMALVLGLLLQPRRRATDLRRLLATHVLVAMGTLAAPFAVQAFLPLSLDLSLILLTQAICLVWSLSYELGRRVSAAREARERRLLHLAFHTPDSDMPNRRALVEALAPSLGRKGAGAVAVVAVGLDRFTVLRDAIGAQTAAQVVRALAKRVGHVTGEETVAQLSPSVLAVAVTGETPDALKARVRALELIDPAFRLQEHAVEASVRLGVANGARGDDPDVLVERAIIALDTARAEDRRVSTFAEKRFGDPSRNLILMTEMRHGLRAGELALHYQPKLTLADGVVTSVEALVRWTHPDRGPVAPQDFISTAEQTGNIRLLTDWVLDQALAEQAELAEAGHKVRVAVNVSGRLLGDRDFRRRLIRKAAGRRMLLEIGEADLVENPKTAANAIAAFREAGFGISIDDYGAGLSSLNHLKLLHADELKLDKALVGAVAEEKRDRLIVKSAVDLAHSLGMKVVAEGVEDEAVRRALARLGCDMVQGYLIARPMPRDELAAFLKRRATRRSRAHA